MPAKKLLSVCIPTYNEHEYLPETLQRLRQQSMFKDMEIVVADYDSEKNGLTKKTAIEVLPDVRIVNVPVKGIGMARKMAVEASTSPFIMSFDADCYFARPDAAELLMRAIIVDGYLLSHAPNFLDPAEKPPPFADILYSIRDIFTAPMGIPTEPGLTMSRATYDLLGGWDDVRLGEAPLLGVKAIMQLGAQAIKYVEEAQVIVSSRRIKEGLFSLNYDKAFRAGGKVLDVK